MTQDKNNTGTPLNEANTMDWVSTYGIMTAERILDYYQLRVPIHDLKRALNQPGNFIHHLLFLPLRNVFNGIIMQQAKDYMIFGQKLFVDYLLSGETTREASSPGGGTREDLEALRKKLVQHSEAFQAVEAQQVRLIYDTQRLFIDTIKQWRQHFNAALKKLKADLEREGIQAGQTQLSQCFFSLLASTDSEIADINHVCWRGIGVILKQTPTSAWIPIFQKVIQPLLQFDQSTETSLQALKERSQSMHTIFKQYRRDFYDYITWINTLLDNLPEYRPSMTQLQKNREEIEFDPNFDVGAGR